MIFPPDPVLNQVYYLNEKKWRWNGVGWAIVNTIDDLFAPLSHVGSGDDAHSLATPLSAGFMSSLDKSKLDGIPENATANTGTVTRVNAGNGMVFTDITGSGAVTMGTPGTLTGTSTNQVTANSHTHALSANLRAWDGLNQTSNFNWVGFHQFNAGLSVQGVPTTPVQGAYIGWNYPGGQGNTLFINNRGLGAGGYAWYDTSSSSIDDATRLMTLSSSGTLEVTGQISSVGAVSGVGFGDRTSSILWQLYSDNETMHIWRPGGNRLSLTTTGDLSTTGSISDSLGSLRKIHGRIVEISFAITTNDLNGVLEKSGNSECTYFIPPGLGTHRDAVTVVNSGSSGNLVVAAEAGVTLIHSGVAGNIVVPPGHMITIFRSATANKWVA